VACGFLSWIAHGCVYGGKSPKDYIGCYGMTCLQVQDFYLSLQEISRTPRTIRVLQQDVTEIHLTQEWLPSALRVFRSSTTEHCPVKKNNNRALQSADQRRQVHGPTSCRPSYPVIDFGRLVESRARNETVDQ
jgi:hypothetical protein